MTDFVPTGTGDWANSTISLFLRAGINRIDFSNPSGTALLLDRIDLATTSGSRASYEAKSSANTFVGRARVASNKAASGGKFVDSVGSGSANTLQFNGVNATIAGAYRMVVSYANGQLGAGASNYNSNFVDEYADISVNGGPTTEAWFRNTSGWSNFRTTVVDVTLNQGANTVEFTNPPTASAPHLDRIDLYADLLGVQSTAIAPPRKLSLVTTLTCIPNPFRDHVEIRSSLSVDGGITCDIYNLSGRSIRHFEVATATCSRPLVWDGRDKLGNSVQSGPYILRFRSGSLRQTGKVMKVD